ncbi:PDZ domain-containing protein [Clostridium sp. 19966]|uniref:site-2 protease family protein n=1 Tax=Clostridium sp. 19966 TaxID=2768166 RepID=UPI0028DFC559|nr:site-2 protease family protein [Clostridium sp. 19966]MDT8716101.1 PDZ domain-containing protein [Clostridium sp. 19966]
MDLAIYTLRALTYAIVDPSLASILIILAFVLFFQNRKVSMMQKMVIGETISSPLELTLSQVVMGIFAGILGSIMLTYAGVMFNQNSGIEIIFIISIILMLIKPKYICFSYSGAVLAFASILTNDVYKYFTGSPMHGFNINIDVTALMTLVGILHIIEGILVVIDGRRGAIPVFTNSDGKIAGGFAYKRYWPIPILIIFLISSSATSASDVVEAVKTPNWWPIISNNYSASFLKSAVMAALPLYAILGYNTVTFTKTKVQKTLISGISILIYGILLTLVAQLAHINFATKVFVIIFAPLAHELMLKIQSKFEKSSKYKFVSDGDGIMVLDVTPKSSAHFMGIKSGDTLLEINDVQIEKETDVIEGIKCSYNGIMKIKLKRSYGREEILNNDKYDSTRKLGVVFVPKSVPKKSMVIGYEDMKFSDFLSNIVNKKNKEDDDKDENNDEDKKQ